MTSMTPRDQRKLARAMGEVAQLRRRVEQQSRSQNLAHSTIVQGEGPQIVTPEGEVVGQVGGTTDGALTPVGPVPDAPSAPTVDVGLLSARVIVTDPWPAGVSLAQVWASTDPAVPGVTVGAIPSGSDATSVALDAGLWHVRLVWVLADGRSSEPSPAAVVDAVPLVDSEDIKEVLAAAQSRLDEVRAALEARRGTEPPTEPDTEGRVYYQVDDTNTPVAVWKFTDGQWVQVPLEDAVFARVSTDQLVAGMALIGGTLIEDGAVTAEHITATEALTAKVAQFLKVEAGMIQSNAFEGQTFTGGTFTGALFQTISTLFRGVKMSGTGLRAWDDTGKLTANIDGKNNLLSGVLRTSPEGEAGLIIDPQNASSRRPVVFFSSASTTSINDAAIYTSPDWDLILRGRMASGVRRSVQIEGGLELLGGAGITGTQGRILVDQVGGNFVHGRDGLGTEGSLIVGGTSQLTGNSVFEGRSDHRGRITLTSGDATASAANMHLDQYGIIRKSTSAARFKADQQDAEVPDALLDLPVKTWIDKRSQQVMDDLDGVMGPLTRTETEDLDAARQAVARRGFGVIAEDVEAIDPRLATYDADGEVEGVAYDRIGPALIPIVRRQRDRIAELEKQVDALASRLDAAGL